MRFHILGPLSVRDGGSSVPIPGRTHPKLLAGLLLNANHPVSVPWLTNLLWDTTPPATAHRQVQNTIAALRRLLHPLHPDLITRRGPDYTLSLTTDTLDLL